MNDKNVEIKRYDSRAAKELQKDAINYFNKIISYMNTPYEIYNKFLLDIPNDSKILEIGAGMGENTENLLEQSSNIFATDISSKSVELMNKRFIKFKRFNGLVADMEKLPFEDGSFDFVCCAGSLSYGDNKIVMNEIYRVLNNQGSFIAVDSLNNNIIYKFNRFIHYLRGNRSKNTLKRMPDLNLIRDYQAKFGSIKVKFYGSLTWLFPILRLFMKDSKLKNFSDKFDKYFNIKASAFKFVMKVTKL